jgi:hypothetical protein
MQEESSIEEDDEENLQGKVQPMVRRSSRKTAKRVVLNIGENNTKTYDAQLNQAVINEIEYDMKEAKLFVMVTQIREKIRCQGQEVESQHIITYSLNKGMKKFGSRAEEVAMKEMEYMIERDCFEPVHCKELNETERRRAMELLIFLSEKKRLLELEMTGTRTRSLLDLLTH